MQGNTVFLGHKHTNVCYVTMHRQAFWLFVTLHVQVHNYLPHIISSVNPSFLVTGLHCTCVPWDHKNLIYIPSTRQQFLGYSWWSIKICAFISIHSCNTCIFSCINFLLLKPNTSLHSLVKLFSVYTFITFCWLEM